MTRRIVSPQEQLHKAIATFGDAPFTLRDLHARLKGRSLDSLRGAVRQLAAAGHVRHVDDRPGTNKLPPAKVFVATRPGTPFVPAAPTAEGETRQQKLWRAMRNLHEWGVTELAAAATTEEVPVDLPCAQAYVSTLVRVGIVQVVRPRISSIGEGSTAASYRLAPSANTGPYAPEVRRGRRVYDANRRRLVDGDEVAA